MIVKVANSSKDYGGASGSAIKKYQHLIIGETSLWFLIKFELIQLFASWVPGALGLLLRKFLYPTILGSVGKNVVFGCNTNFRHPKKIHIGDNALIDDNCLIDAKGESNNGVSIGDGVFIGRNTILSCKNGDIVLEDNVNIGFNCEIYSGNLVTVKENSIIAAYCYLVGGDGYSLEKRASAIAFNPIHHPDKNLLLNKDCWIGAHCTVFNGVEMGEGAVLAAGSVATQNLSPYSIYGGSPAKLIKERPEQSMPTAS